MTLVGAYTAHPDALRASLRAEYQVDLRHPGMSLMDLGDLVAWLPPQSALHRAEDPEGWQWGPAEMLAALAVDEIRYMEYLYLMGAGFKGKHKPPKPIQRPGVEPDDKTYGGKGTLPMDEMAEWLGGPFAALSN